MATRDTPSSFSPDVQRLLDQGFPPQQVMAMLQQNNANAAVGKPPGPPPAHPQNLSLVPSFPGAGPHDPAAFFSGLDASSSKQLAALTAAGNTRRATLSGGTSGSFVGGIPSPQHPFGSTSSALSHSPPIQLHQAPHNAVGLNPSAPFNMPPGDPSALQRQAMMAQQQMSSQNYRTRQQSFLQGLAKCWAARNMPLPPSITGVPYPYDPASSVWKTLEPTSEIGGIKLAGKDVDLFKLWGLIYSAGGVAKIQQNNAWSALLQPLGLPDTLPQPQDSGNTSTAVTLARIVLTIIVPFEEMYVKSVSEAQRQNSLQHSRPAQPFTGQMGAPTTGGITGSQFPANGMTGFPGQTPQTPQMRSSGSMMNMMQTGQPGHSMSPPGSAGGIAQAQVPNVPEITGPSFPGTGDFDADAESRKRKLNDFEDINGKRTRRRTDSEGLGTPSRPDGLSQANMQPSSSSAAALVRGQPLRRKIEYVPLAREIETAGGRDLSQIQAELQRLQRGRPLRDINEWGKVYVEALTLSLRSRLSGELAYALGTLIMFSTMRGAAPDTGFPLHQCDDLLDEVCDLLEELAFEDDEDTDGSVEVETTAQIITQRELVKIAQEQISDPFAPKERQQGEHDPTRTGPVQRRGDTIRLIINMIRNFSTITDNAPFLAQNAILTDLLLRLTTLRFSSDGTPRPASSALTLSDLILIRKDVLNTLTNLSGMVNMSPSSLSPVKSSRRACRIFELVSSYLIDPADAVSPVAWIIHSGTPLAPNVRPPLLPDAALEVFARISQPDANRQIFSSSVSKEWIWRLFEALVHRMPTTDNDFSLIYRDRDEAWLAYIEKIAMSLYSLAFLMPPELKKRVKADRSLGFAKILLGAVKRFTNGQQQDVRIKFWVCCRRTIETLKIIDDGDDSFDSSQPSVPLLSFGMGYGEGGDKKVEKGNGLWSGYRDEVLWSIMLMRDMDEPTFAELESLARVDADFGISVA